jgi:hypothetical protein
MSPTQRTLEYLRLSGYPLVGVVERWIPRALVRQDLFGILDVLVAAQIFSAYRLPAAAIRVER